MRTGDVNGTIEYGYLQGQGGSWAGQEIDFSVSWDWICCWLQGPKSNLTLLTDRSHSGYTNMVDNCGYEISLQNIMEWGLTVPSVRELARPCSMPPLDRKAPQSAFLYIWVGANWAV
jgi:hypothetical protein